MTARLKARDLSRLVLGERPGAGPASTPMSAGTAGCHCPACPPRSGGRRWWARSSGQA